MSLLAALLFALSPELERAFDHFYSLEFDQAIRAFEDLTKQSPAQPELRNHLAQSILYREMLKAGAMESELVTGGNAFLRRPKMNPSAADQKEFDEALAASIRICRARLDKDPRDRSGLYNLGIAYGLKANYDFLVRHAWMDALRDATSGRKIHNRLSEVDPKYVDARLTQGIHDYVIGSLSWHYKFLGFLAGFRGDKETGIKTVEMVRKHGENNRDDAAIILATIYRREKRPSDAVALLLELSSRYPRNYLFLFELAQMYSDLGDKEKALAAVAQVEKQKNVPVEKVIYYRATIQFWYMDLDEALKNFLVVTAKADDLDPNSGVTAWMRLGQTYDLLKQRQKAIEAYRKTIAYAPGSYRAKESEEYLRKPFRRTDPGKK